MPTLTIPTSNRPEALQTCLGSFVDRDQQFERILILDDSGSEKANTANEAAVGSVQGGRARSLEHVTRHKKKRLISRLKEISHGAIPETAIDFALFGDQRLQTVRGAGCNRNAGLLLCAGDRLVSIDDDARYGFSQTVQTAGAETKPLLYTPEPEFRELHVTGAVDSQRRIENLTEPLNEDAASLLLSNLSKQFETAPGRHGRVRLAMSGIVGNRWYDRPEALFFNEGPLREEIYRKRRRYLAARESGLAIMQAPAATATDATFFVTCFSAMDAKNILPPFPPAGHADDTLFSLVMKGCYPNDLIAHLPFVVRHDLGPPRPVRKEHFYRKGVTFNLMTGALIREASAVPQTDAADAAMRLIGRRMQRLAELSHEEWIEQCHDLRMRRIARTIEGLERRLERYNEKPAFWARDVERHIDFLRTDNIEPSHAVPRELLVDNSEEDATALHRDFFRSYGELLTVWPEIWQAARTLNEDRIEVIH